LGWIGDDEAGFHQRIDQQTGWPLDRDRDVGRRPVLAQARDERLEADAIVADGKTVQDLSLGIDHANGVRAAAPVDADQHRHGLLPSLWPMIRLPVALAGCSFIGAPGGSPRRIFL
jgi:hypothetical protein